MNYQNKSIVALDVGGSSVKSGLVLGDTVDQLKTTSIDSKGDSETIIATFSDIINSYSALNNIEGIAFSMPGPFDYERGISYMGPGQKKYEAIHGLNLKKSLLEKIPKTYQISFRDDGESAIVGEALFGAGRPYERLLGITLGTGIGSAFVVAGQPRYSGEGIIENTPLYDCLWENERADEVFSIRGLTSRLYKIGFIGEPKKAFELARSNQEIKTVFENWGNDLGQFLNAYATSFQAEAVLVQGGLSGAFDLFGDQMQKHLKA